jgi:hypothetical protein
MDGACGTNGGYEKCLQNLARKLQDPCVDERIILKWIDRNIM